MRCLISVAPSVAFHQEKEKAFKTVLEIFEIKMKKIGSSRTELEEIEKEFEQKLSHLFSVFNTDFQVDAVLLHKLAQIFAKFFDILHEGK